MFDVCGITVRVAGKSLLDSVDLRLRRGRVTAILGPNGAGKSTLLQCLAGLREPEEGRVLLSGAVVTDLADRERARRIGFLPQQAPLHWNITVRSLVALGRTPRRVGYGRLGVEDEAAIGMALELTDAAHLADRLAGTLSGGELTRAHLARVLAGEPEWILADEPFAALDIAHRFDLADRLRAIAASGEGVVVVLHDIGLAARLADDIVLLDRGRLVQAGNAEEVLASSLLAEVFGVRLSRHVDAAGVVSIVATGRFP